MDSTKEMKGFGWKKVLLFAGLFIVIILLAGIVYVNHYVKQSLPQVDGEIQIPVGEEVTVTTDENGVPHIEASSLEDLYTAQGYVQAQSRMFQMELSRRQASGTLSEVVGSSTVSSDQYFRTLGLRRAAEASYEIYTDDAKEVLDWFSDGVNAYMEQAKKDGTLPYEFTLLGTEPEPWTPIDSLTIGKYMAFDLGGHWERQAFNYYLLDEYPEEKALELFPTYPDEGMTIMEDSEMDVATSLKEAVIPPAFNGSNDWVVSGDKTESGLPLLADDPHLGLSTPSIWYQMHLEADDMNVSGVIFAGVPGIILGHNEKIAWGVTNTGPDVQQLYVEKRNPDEADEFLFAGEYEKAEQIEEPIHVKGDETIDYVVTETRHGPIISEFAEKSGEDDVLSLRWTALDPTTELQAIIKMNQADNWVQFEKGLEDFHAPAQNFVFASVDGTIAYKANGKIPIYEDGKDALLPLPGWEAAYEWDDFIPFEELPRVVNPEKGFIATANNKIADDDYPYHISNVWAQPYRYERIYEVLAEDDQLTIEDMQDLQMDTMNLRAREFVPYFADILAEADLTEAETEALKHLVNWDFKDKAEQGAPLIFDRWIAEIEQMLFDEISDDMLDFFSGQGQTTDELLREGDGSIWMSDHGGLEKVLTSTLRQTVRGLEKEYGTNQENWQWGKYHQVQFKHPLAAANKALGYFVHQKDPLPVDGSSVTPMAASHDGTGLVDHGASWRFVIDMETPETGYHIVGPGQSGHLKSPWYSDQTEDWIDGTYHETTMNEAAGEVLRLVPQ